METRTERIDIMSNPSEFDTELKKECDLKGTKGYHLSAASTVTNTSTNKLDVVLTFQGEGESAGSINTETKTRRISLLKTTDVVDKLIRQASDLLSDNYVLKASFILSDDLILAYQK
ncbi:MAG: hypothetical protein ACYTDW_06360 [Planctomycetota bacterium]|jgi:16S rRNA C1402 N4-methylase RsmH